MHIDPCIQVDVECEYGYERHAEECRPIFGLESAKCAVLDRENYVISETKHRLIDGDSCKGLSQIIGDTDGKGNLPGGHHGRHPNRGWGGATLFLIMLVRSPPEASWPSDRSLNFTSDACILSFLLARFSRLPVTLGMHSRGWLGCWALPRCGGSSSLEMS